MRWMILLLFLVVSAAACKKGGDADQRFSAMKEDGPFVGVWVETSLGKDTINFNVAQSWLEQLPWQPPPNAGVFIMGSDSYKNNDGSVNSPGGVYSYYRSGSDSLQIYSYFTSNSKYAGFKFTLGEGQTTFKIGRFYTRPGLPDELTFSRKR